MQCANITGSLKFKSEGQFRGVVIRTWVWLECRGVVSGWCCKEVYIFPHIAYPYSTRISSFLQQQHPLGYFFVHFLNVFFVLVYVFLCNIINVAQRTFEIVQKSISRRHGDIHVIISTSMSHYSPVTSMCEVLSDVLSKLRADIVYDNGIVEISLLHV